MNKKVEQIYPPGTLLKYGKTIHPVDKQKHKHKWFPTNETVKLDINKNPTTNPKEAEYTERKWVCECGAVKWIREIEEDDQE